MVKRGVDEEDIKRIAKRIAKYLRKFVNDINTIQSEEDRATALMTSISELCMGVDLPPVIVIGALEFIKGELLTTALLSSSEGDYEGPEFR